MQYTISSYKTGECLTQKSYQKMHEVFAHLATLSMSEEFDRCVLQDHATVVFELRFDHNGKLKFF